MNDARGVVVDLDWGPKACSVATDHVVDSPLLQIIRHRGESREPFAGQMRLKDEWYGLRFGTSGALVYQEATSFPLRISPPSSVDFLRGPIWANLKVARGSFESLLFAWKGSLTAGLRAWIDQKSAAEGGVESVRNSSFLSLDSHGLLLSELAGRAMGSIPQTQVTDLLALAHWVVPKVLMADTEMTLASLRTDVAPPLIELMAKVKQDPTKPWSLKDAGQIAGYSSFYLSRFFRAQVGMSFPSFVDQCRAEIAVGFLIGTESSIEEVAHRAGFSCNQALRDALREHLGLLPNEIRAMRAT